MATTPVRGGVVCTIAKDGTEVCDPLVVPPYEVPVTPGRDLGGPSPWNVWADLSYANIQDSRRAVPFETSDRYLSLGADYEVRLGFVVGLQAEFERISTDALGGLVSGKTNTIALGPYFGLQVSGNWVLSGLLTFGLRSTDIDILDLEGSYNQDRIHGNLSALGQYDVGRYIIRPSATLDVLHLRSASYELEGMVLGVPETIIAEAPSSTYTALTPEIEISLPIVSNDAIWTPYVDLGVSYDFNSSNSDTIAAKAFEDSSWLGQTHLGLRARISETFYLDASVGYAGLFQNDLDIYTAELYIALDF